MRKQARPQPGTGNFCSQERSGPPVQILSLLQSWGLQGPVAKSGQPPYPRGLTLQSPALGMLSVCVVIIYPGELRARQEPQVAWAGRHWAPFWAEGGLVTVLHMSCVLPDKLLVWKIEQGGFGRSVPGMSPTPSSPLMLWVCDELKTCPGGCSDCSRGSGRDSLK